MAVVLFDFDRTLTSKDSFKSLIMQRFYDEPFRLILVLLGLPIFVLTALFHFDKRYAKGWLLWSCTVGLSARQSFEFLENAASKLSASGFLTENGQGFWLRQAIDRMHALRKEGHTIGICTASAEEWVRPLLKNIDAPFDFIVATQIGYRFGGLVVVSANCYEKEKVVRLSPYIANQEVIECYSDHPCDAPLLNLGKKAFLISPSAAQLDWFARTLRVPYEVLDWNPRS